MFLSSRSTSGFIQLGHVPRQHALQQQLSYSVLAGNKRPLALRFLQALWEVPGRRATSGAGLPLKHLATLSCMQAALPAASRALVCQDGIIRFCCKSKLLEVGCSSDGVTLFWLTAAGQAVCRKRFGTL